MPNTYTQLYVHVVFAVKGRANLISDEWKPELYRYMIGIVTNQHQKMMIVNGVSDHVHLLIGYKPDISLSALVRDIKANSSRWINERKFVQGKFEWQVGFGAFSVGHTQVKMVTQYILNQEAHHKKKTFRKEYLDFMHKNGIDFRMDYLPEDFGETTKFK